MAMPEDGAPCVYQQLVEVQDCIARLEEVRLGRLWRARLTCACWGQSRHSCSQAVPLMHMKAHMRGSACLACSRTAAVPQVLQPSQRPPNVKGGIPLPVSLDRSAGRNFLLNTTANLVCKGKAACSKGSRPAWVGALRIRIDAEAATQSAYAAQEWWTPIGLWLHAVRMSAKTGRVGDTWVVLREHLDMTAHEGQAVTFLELVVAACCPPHSRANKRWWYARRQLLKLAYAARRALVSVLGVQAPADPVAQAAGDDDEDVGGQGGNTVDGAVVAAAQVAGAPDAEGPIAEATAHAHPAEHPGYDAGFAAGYAEGFAAGFVAATAPLYG